MKFLYLELNGYKRFGLSQIEHFAITITQSLQLILGSNGSGKSSLLEQLSPLPAAHTDFTKQGSKILKLEHHHTLYTLKSVFNPVQKHSFVADNVELNEGGTVTVQKELVKQHFGITSEIQEVLLGREVFTEMSPARRKEWLLRLCDTNYDYAIKVYNKLKERHRDTVGAFKIANKRLVVESEKLIKTDEELKLKAETQSLHDTLSHLLEYRKPVEKDMDVLNIEQDQIDLSLLKISTALNIILENNKTDDIFSLEAIDIKIKECELQSYASQMALQTYSKEHSLNHEKIVILERAEKNTISTLSIDAKKLKDKILQLTGKRLVLYSTLNTSTMIDAFESVKPTLLDVFSNIPENKDKRFSQEKLLQAKEKINALRLEKTNLLTQVQTKQVKLKHMLEHKEKPDLSCPSCHHKFSLNYNDKQFNALTKDIETIESVLDKKIQPAIEKIETYLEECNQYGLLYRQYTQCVNGFAVLKPYWNYLSDKQTVTDNPHNGLNEINAIENDLKISLLIEEHTKELDRINDLLHSLASVGGEDLSALVRINDDLQIKIDLTTTDLQMSENAKSKFIAYKVRLNNIQALTDQIQKYILNKKMIRKDQMETLRRTELNNVIRQLQSALASREYVLNHAQLQHNTVNTITNQIYELEKQEESLNLLIKQLSPTDGLIAEGLISFINGFVSQMNNIINKVWSYSLQIKTCELEGDSTVDLDYKFPMMVKEKENVVSDVSKGSTGQKEIINLSFRLTAMRYLRLQGYPLMLDEEGRALDPSHKAASVYLIKTLLEQQSFTQVFMISHDFSQYGALSNCEVCVLSDTNIVVPPNSNEHVIIK